MSCSQHVHVLLLKDFDAYLVVASKSSFIHIFLACIWLNNLQAVKDF